MSTLHIQKEEIENQQKFVDNGAYIRVPSNQIKYFLLCRSCLWMGSILSCSFYEYNEQYKQCLFVKMKFINS